MKRQLALIALTLTAGIASAQVTDLNKAIDLVEPSFRGDANTTWLGWNVFFVDVGDPIDQIIYDTTPDIGVDSGSFITTNGEDHLSGSLNYYSGFGTVAEDITFDTDGTAGSGFTTVIIQAKTLFSAFGSPIEFSALNGVLPTVVSTATAKYTDTNAAGFGQLFAKYEVPGLDGPQTISITGGAMVSFDQFVIDTVWSADGFAPDSAIATPEPAAAALALLGVLAGAFRARR